MHWRVKARRGHIQPSNSQGLPKVAIIVLNWNGWRDTLECLESVQQLSYPNYLTIIVDNGSQDDSVKRIKAWARENMGKGRHLVEYIRAAALQGGEGDKEEAFEGLPSEARLVLIRNGENLGFTGGNNVAIHYAIHRKFPGEYIFLLNNDAKVKKDSITHLVDSARRANAGIVGAVVREETTGQIQSAGCNGDFPLIRQFFQPITRWPVQPPGYENDFWASFWVSGVAMLIRRSTLKDVYALTGRYLDSRLFLYGEDFEFCCTARKVGYKSITSKHGVVYHKKAKSSGGRYGPIEFYYSNRNRVILANEFLTLWLKIIFRPFNVITTLGRVLKNVVYKRFQSASAILHALIDGYRGVTGKWKRQDEELRRFKGK